MGLALPLKGFIFVLLYQCLGELIAQIFHLPFPGQVIGLILLALSLRSKTISEPVQACANILLSNLSLLFIPITVGVITQWNYIGAYSFKLIFVLIASCAIGILVTAFVLSHLLKNKNAQNGTEQGHQNE